jgi:hypothetical protein
MCEVVLLYLQEYFGCVTIAMIVLIYEVIRVPMFDS